MKSVKHRSIVSFSLTATLALVLAGCDKSSNVSEAEHLARAKAFQAQGKIQGQVIELKNILQNNPNHSEAHRLLGEVYSEMGYGKDAEKELLRAQELGIDPEIIRVPLGKALLDQKEYKRVLNEIQPSPKSTPPTIAAIKTLYAQAEIGQRQFEKGCSIFREAKVADPTYVPAYWGVAQCSLGFGKPIEAEEEIDAALKVDPKNVGSWLIRGDLRRNQKQLVEAEKAYTSGLAIQPDNLALLLARATTRVPQNNHPGALEDITAAEKQVKDHPLALHLRGIMLYKDKKYDDAKASFEAVLKNNPDYLPSILWIGMSDYALNNLEQAGRAFSKYVSVMPNASEVQAFLAITKARLGGKKAATDVLGTLEKLDVNDAQTLVLIGQAHLLTGDDQASARYLSRAIEKKPDAIDPRVSLVAALLQKGDKPGAVKQAEEIFKKSPSDVRSASILISALLENQQADKALEVVRQLEPNLPKSPIPHIFRAAIKAKTDDFEGAKTDLEKAQKIQPDNVLVSHSLAAIAIKQGKLEDARRYYQHAKEKNGDQFETLMAMYDLEVLAKQPAAARKLLDAAAAKYPNAPRPAMLLGRAYVNAGQPDKALKISDGAAEFSPNDIDLLVMRGSAYFDKGDSANALVSFNRVVKLQPDLVNGHINLALVHNAKGDYTASRNDLQRALRLDGKNPRARLMLAGLNIRDKKYDEAIKLSSSVELEDPTRAEAYVLQSTALTGLKRDADALAALERAKKALPDSEIPPMEIAKLQFQAGKVDEGFKSIQSWLDKHPDNVIATAFLAESLMIQNKNDEAIAVYERILKAAPNHPIALNNLAILFTERDPERAVKYAAQAAERAPGDPALSDTYGWLLLKTGDPKRGLSLIKSAYEAAPYSIEIHYHLAVAMAQNGEKAQAKKELEKIVNIQGDFPLKREAQALMTTL